MPHTTAEGEPIMTIPDDMIERAAKAGYEQRI